MSLYRRWIGGQLLTDYVSSISDDAEIAEAVVEVMRAHVAHLAEVGAVPREAAEAVLRELEALDPRQLLAEGHEDVHEALEAHLIRRLGEEAAGWIGLGRSRNDHVAAAIRLAALRRARRLAELAGRARCLLAQRALEYADCPMPGFTHFQPAQAITFGHYLLALDELLAEFQQLLKSAEGLLSRSPLGAGPVGGVKAPLDRHRLARLAGFSSVVENALYASSSRLFASALASAAASFLAELSRFADDLIRWNSPLIGYVKAPDSHVSTSSIMPHKRNLVTLEVLRARASEAVGHLAALLAIQLKIGYGYSLDLQEATRHLWAILRTAEEGLEVLTDFLGGMSFDCSRARSDASRFPTTSSDTAEARALAGVPFRRAYFQLAREIAEGRAELLPLEEALRRPVLGSADPQEVRRAAAARAALCRPPQL